MKLSVEIEDGELRRWSRRLGIIGALVISGGAVYASAAAIVNPAAFSAGDVIRAADVNAAFKGLTDAVNGIDTRTTALESAATTLVVDKRVPISSGLDSHSWSVYAACPTGKKPVGGGCALYQRPDQSGSDDYETNSTGMPSGCFAALGTYSSPSGTSYMCLRTGTEVVGGTIYDGNGGHPTVTTVGWKCSVVATSEPPFQIEAYVSCQP